MSVTPLHPESKSKPSRRRFHQAAPGEQAVKIAPPQLDLDNAVLQELLPDKTLEAMARKTNALDQRQRKLTCAVFFWLIVLALRPGVSLNLTTLVSMAVTACLMAGMTAHQAVLSKQAISENFQRRPWQFFAEVLQYLLVAYATLFATPLGAADLALIQHLLLIDATVIRVANTLIQTFPAHRTGRRAEWAALKLHLAFRLFRAVPAVLAITAQKVNERKVDFLRPRGELALYVFDLGYWWYWLFDEIIERGQHFISRLRSDCNPLIKAVYQGSQEWVGKRLKDITLIGTEIDLLVNLSSANPANPRMVHDVRLVGQWVSENQAWHLYITSILERSIYTIGLIVQIYALRWQIEILFRDLKSVLGIVNFISTSENGVRIQIYAALIRYLLTRLIILKAAYQTSTLVEEFSIPKCLIAVGQIMTQTVELIVKEQTPNWVTLENRLVEVVIAVGRRPNRKRGHRLSRVKAQFQAQPIPAAAPP